MNEKQKDTNSSAQQKLKEETTQLLSAVEEYRTAHPLDAALRPRSPAPAFTYYG